MPFPPGFWGTVSSEIYAQLNASGFSNVQVGSSAYNILDQLLAAAFGWFGQELEPFLGQNAAQIAALINPHTSARASEISANVNTQTQGLHDHLEGTEGRVIAAIGGGASNTDALLVPLNRISDVIIANEDRLEPVLKEWLEKIQLAVNTIGGGASSAAGAIRGDLVQALGRIQIQLANVNQAQVADAITEGLGDAPESLKDILLAGQQLIRDFFQVSPEAQNEITLAAVPDPRRLKALLPWIISALSTGLAVDQVTTGGRLTRSVTDNLPFLAEAASGFVTGIGEQVVHGVEAFHQPMRGVMSGLAGLFFESIDGELAGLGQADPNTVLPMAQQLLTLAASLGATSHLMAVLSENIHGAKHLGIPFVSAFLTDLAGFQDIAKHSFGVQYETALREPARRRANNRFRPALPDVGSVVQMWYERRISDGDLRAFYQQQGWPEEWITTQLQTLPIEASPRDLALVFEDGDVDEEWAVRHLVERGFTDDDAARIASGVRTKSLRTARGSAVTAVMGAYERGLLDASGVAQRLRPLRLSDQAIELYLLGSDMDRYRIERTELRTELLAQASAGVMSPEDVGAALAAYGYDARAQQHTAALARLRASRKLFQEVATETKAATRRAQQTAITAAQEEFRRGLLTDAGLAATLRDQGVTEAEVDSLVDLARVRRVPVPKLADVLTPEAQAQRALDEESDRVVALLKRRQIDEATAQASLIGLGVDPDEAGRRVRLATAQVAKPPDRFTPRPVNDVIEEARRLKMAAARDEFRAGLIDLNALGARLADAGIEPAVVNAVVQFEDSKRRADAARASETASARETSTIRRQEQDKAVAAFRAGDLDESGLLANLLAIGVLPSLAETIVESEVQRRDVEAAGNAEAADARTAAQDQSLREDAVVFGFRNNLVDEDQALELLADAGVTEIRARLLIQREQARKKPAAASSP